MDGQREKYQFEADFVALHVHERVTSQAIVIRLILGDSLQMMASSARREGLVGQVQMIYIDPPYGIKFTTYAPEAVS